MNKVTLLGRLTKDPEIKCTEANNTTVAKFTLAVNRKFAKKGEEKQTDFINIVVWNKLADTVAQYLVKGKQVIVIGRMQTRVWTDKDNSKHYVTEVIGEEIEFVDSKTTQENTKNDESSEAIQNEEETVTEENTEDILSGDDLPF